MSKRYRITIKGEGMELRGYVGIEGLKALAAAVEPFGALLMASPVADDYDPFDESA